MKVRIGVGVGSVAPAEGDRLAALVDDLDALGFDSIWLPEVLSAPTLGPVAALAFAAGRNPRLKLGTTMLLPGRNPVRLAKELATLDVLSGGRLLVTFVPGLPRGTEVAAAGLAAADRGRLMDELLPLVRRLWTGEPVTHRGEAADFEDVTVSPVPVQQPLEFWTGGMGCSALRRCGRFADGWLPSSCTPDEVAAARPVVEAAAADAGRSISPEHFGVSVAYSDGPLDPKVARAVAASRAGVDPEAVVPAGLGALRDLLERFVDVGFSKFVVRPLATPRSWRAELEALSAAVGDLQT